MYNTTHIIQHLVEEVKKNINKQEVQMPRGRKKNVEPKEEKSFSVVEEGEVIVKKLCEKYPEIWGTIN